MVIQPEDLPENMREVARRLYRRGFIIEHDRGMPMPWTLVHPIAPSQPPRPPASTMQRQVNPAIRARRPGAAASQPVGPPVARRDRYADETQLNYGMLSALRQAETRDHTLVDYDQFDRRWAQRTYGPPGGRGYSDMQGAGCGPTSLAIVMQYISNNSPDQRQILPTDTADYAALHGRVRDHGTNADVMISGLPGQWPGFAGRSVTLQEAETLLRRGELIIYLCRGCRGFSRNHGRPVGDPDRGYPGHYMVLSGMDPPTEGEQLFWVLDPGGNSGSGIYRIQRSQLTGQTSGGLWYVYRSEENLMTQAGASAVSGMSAGVGRATSPTNAATPSVGEQPDPAR